MYNHIIFGYLLVKIDFELKGFIFPRDLLIIAEDENWEKNV